MKNVAETNETVSYIREKGESKIYQEIIVRARVDTVTKAFNYAVQKYGEKDCLGTRQVLGKIIVVDHAIFSNSNLELIT